MYPEIWGLEIFKFKAARHKQKQKWRNGGSVCTLPGSTHSGNRNITNYHRLVHLDLSNSWINPTNAHYTLLSLFSGCLFMTSVTSQLCFYFKPGDRLVVTSEHVLRCGGLMVCNHCKWANLSNLRCCPAISVAAFNHMADSARLSDCQPQL